MKTLGIVVLCLSLSGCSSLILRDDDTTGQTVAKVTARSLLAPVTLLWSEAFIKKAKEEEAEADRWVQRAVYFNAKCQKEGYAPGTAEHTACVSMGYDSFRSQDNQAVMPLLMMPPAPRHSATCYSGGSGRYVTCY
jgi:hypothetical protein